MGASRLGGGRWFSELEPGASPVLAKAKRTVKSMRLAAYQSIGDIESAAPA